jgi:SSS family solute:Na+ symporter
VGALAPLDWAVIGLYLLLMLGLGAIIARRVHHFRDYFLAGGALTTPILVCTLVSTYYELDVTFAVSESGYHYGLVSWVWLSRPYYVAIILAALLLAPRIKRYGAMTLPDILEHHYGRGARVLGATACFVYSLPITALAGMILMMGMLGWPPHVGVLVTVGVCAAYTVMGGLWADAISDTMQFLLMCVTLAMVIPPALRLVGGFDFTAELPPDHMTPTGGLPPGLILAWTLGALTIFVEPAFYQRIFAARDVRSVRRALIIGVALWAAYDWGATLIGMVARAAVDSGVLGTEPQGKEALLAVALHILPVGLKGLFIGGVLAAAMSSIDSYCLLASGNLVYDIMRPLRRRPLSDRALMRLTRLGVFAVMGVALLASFAFQRLTDAWVFMSGALVSVVFVPVMGALFLRPAAGAGVCSAGAGLAALVAFHVMIYTKGAYDEEAESMVLRIAGLDLWREYAVLAALPISVAGFAAGHLVSRRRP